MGAPIRRVTRVLLFASLLATLGASVGVAEVAAAPVSAASHATSATPGVPTSTIKSTGATSVEYCVSNYAPNSTVTVVNELTGARGTIHTGPRGSGCTRIGIERACNETISQTIVATGSDAKGNPATSSATDNAPARRARCTGSSPTPTPSPTSTCAPTKAILDVYILPEGATLRGRACGFRPGETVFIYLHSTPIFVGSTIASADGTAAKRVSIPMCIAPGQHIFEFVGQASGNVASATFTVTKTASGCNPGSGGGSTVNPISAGGGGQNGSGSGGGSLAFTGADIAAMVLVALGLLVLGTIATVTVRRRRTV
jgi:hypothetical protein